MTPREKLLLDIESLKESLQHDWTALSKSLTAAERRNIRQQINGCWVEMKKLRNLLKGPGRTDAKSDGS